MLPSFFQSIDKFFSNHPFLLQSFFPLLSHDKVAFLKLKTSHSPTLFTPNHLPTSSFFQAFKKKKERISTSPFVLTTKNNLPRFLRKLPNKTLSHVKIIINFFA